MIYSCFDMAEGSSLLVVNKDYKMPQETVQMSAIPSTGKAEPTRTSKFEETSGLHAGKKYFKIVCVGDYSGGWSKSVHIEDYKCLDDTLSENPHNNPVIGVDFSLKVVYDKFGKELRLQIWNIGEQERFGNMTKVYFRNTDCAIVFWGAMSQSFESALKWKNDICQTLERDVPIVLIVDNVFKNPAKWVGKNCLVNSTDEMDKFCSEEGFIAWFEMQKRTAGENSVFGQAVNLLINEIISTNYSEEQTEL